MQYEYIQINGEKLYFYLQKKSVKNMILKVKSNKEIYLTVPKRVTIKQAKEFVAKKIDWIKKQQNYYENFEDMKETTEFNDGDRVYFLGKKYILKIMASEKNQVEFDNEYLKLMIKEKYIENKEYIKNTYNKILREYAMKLFQDLVIKYQALMKKYGIKFPEIEIRKMKSRWGSCFYTKNKIVLNFSLIKTPMSCIEYVIVHELSHFKYHNHSKDFYNFVSIFVPDWKERRRVLNKEYGFII